MRGVVKLFFGLVLGLAVAGLIAFNALLAWVAAEPRSLAALTPYIEGGLTPADHSYSVSIGETWLIWDGWKRPVDIRLKNVKLLTGERRSHVSLPEVSLGLDLFSLLRGRIVPTSLTIARPVISLLQNEDRSISFGLSADAVPEEEAPPPDDLPAVPFIAVLAPLIAPDASGPFRLLQSLSVVDADLTITSRRKGVLFKAGGATLAFKRKRGDLEASGSAGLRYGDYHSLVAARLVKKKGDAAIAGEVSVSDVMLGALADLFGGDPLLAALQFPVSGKAALVMDGGGAIRSLDFVAGGGAGEIVTDRLDGPAPLNELHVEGRIESGEDRKLQRIVIRRLSADLDGIRIDGSGAAVLHEAGPAIEATVAARGVPAAKVRLLWPPGLSPMSREWVTENILEGHVPQAQAKIAIVAGDLAKPVLPREAVDASITLEGAKIRYLPEHPEVTAVKGTIRVDGVRLEASIDSARYMKDTALSDGTLRIKDLNADNPYIEIDLTARAAARDAVRFLGLPRLGHAKRLNLREENTEGEIQGKASLGFTFFAPKDAEGRPLEPEIDYEVAAELKDVSQPGFMEKFDLRNISGALRVDKAGVEFTGGGGVNGASVSAAEVKYLFMPEQGFDTFIEVAASTPVEALPRFGYPPMPFLTGALGVKASVKLGGAGETTRASLDLMKTGIAVDAIGLVKPAGEAATLELHAEKKDGAVSIPQFHFKSESAEAKGEAELHKDMSGLRKVRLERYVSGASDLARVVYERTENRLALDVQGKSADMRPWMTGEGQEPSFSFERFPPLALKIDAQRVVMGRERELAAVKGHLSCTAERCGAADIAGTTTDGEPFHFRIAADSQGRRQLSVQARSAGAFLKATDLFDGMEGGDLSIAGDYTGSGKLQGRLDIRGYTIKNASLLAKLFSMASLTGFFDTLQGKGIQFSRLIAPFTLEKDVITLEKAKTHGDALGMTADGTITFPKTALDVEGAIVPSYTLNQVLGNVPILGEVLTGGEGQGVFAVRYRIRGTPADPDISVNPLSILTPGFLRGLFDIFDAPAKEKRKKDN